MDIDDPVTAESITLAREAQQRARDEVYQRTGLRITDAGVRHPATIIHCPRCRYRAVARSEGQAVRSLGAHLVTAHLRQEG